MKFVDGLSPAMRAVVHDYGAEFVHGMWLDGHRNAAKLRAEAQAARERAQERLFS